MRGDQVRAQTGTDDNALKNVQSAEAEGVTPAAYVAKVSAEFAALRDALDTYYDDFVQTSVDPRHLAGAKALWEACAASGDFYTKNYTGLYCVGCETFYGPGDLTDDGLCAEHGTRPELVEETNWFFRLSRYQDQLLELIDSGRLQIEPAGRKREVLSFIRSGLEDFSSSRSVARARGWGIPVPGDPGQVMYVWFDALANYITGPGYGTAPQKLDRWWTNAERVHVIGKGILRFHAVYWPAMLLSAGLPVPNTIYVHDYLTAGGEKISKSAGNAENPVSIIGRYGADAVRWWLLREVPRVGDADYTDERLIARANEELANKIGNLVNRTVSMIHRYRDGAPPAGDVQADPASALSTARSEAAGHIDHALEEFDLRRATSAIVRIAEEGNRYIEATRPWELARADGAAELDQVLGELLASCRDLGEHLDPFLPILAERITAQCQPENGKLPMPSPVFRRLENPG